MSGAAVSNPLLSDPAVSAALELVRAGALGRPLAIYAVTRARAELADPLLELGLPLLDILLTGAGEPAVSVTAIELTSGDGFAHWSLVIGFAAGLRASVDIGAGLGRRQPESLDLRIEWSGSDRVVLVDPARVAVTIASAMGVGDASAEVTPVATTLLEFAGTARAIAADPPPEWRDALALLEAARRSQAEGGPIRP